MRDVKANGPGIQPGTSRLLGMSKLLHNTLVVSTARHVSIGIGNVQ